MSTATHHRATSALLGYHADDDIRRVAIVAGVAIAITLVIIGVALMRRLAAADDAGSNRVARAAAAAVAPGIATYLLVQLNAFDDPDGIWYEIGGLLALLIWLSGLLGLVLAPIGLARVRTRGERRLAVLTFVGSLVLPGIFVAYAIACLTTDACFH